MRKRLSALFSVSIAIATAQNVAINGSGAAPAASAMLDISSTTSGLLIPRMSTVQRTAIGTPATGLYVYDTTTGSFWYYNGTSWIEMTSSTTGWLLAGNTLAGTERLGSNNAQPVRFFTNATERARIISSGEFVVNNTVPFAGDMLSSYSTGTNVGVAGYNTSSGFGVFGSNNSTGRGIIGLNSSASTGRAVEAQNSSASNTDFSMGSFHYGNGRAGNFQNQLASNTSIALFASNLSTQVNANTAGIWGQSSGVRGIVGLASLANVNSIGINGQYIGAGNIDAIGVLGLANSAIGWGYGVYGQANYRAVFANGNQAATGTKAFQIDHPLDPENKFLMHYSIESPEVLNVYRGVVVLDANGEAFVTLPSYFESININFSYQLTATGASMPNLYVAEEITNAKFKISGGVAGKKVSWAVYSERNDEWVKKYPFSKEVEAIKKPHEKGKYLRPELYNQPKEKGIFNAEQQKLEEAESQQVKTKNRE